MGYRLSLQVFVIRYGTRIDDDHEKMSREFDKRRHAGCCGIEML